MTDDSGDMAAFITARLDDDGADARGAASLYGIGDSNYPAWHQGTHAVPGWDQDMVYTGKPADPIDICQAIHGELVAAHIVRQDPAATLARAEALRALVADIQAEKHEVVEGDNWYTCAVATDERDGGTTSRDDPPDVCDCGRDLRVEQLLRLTARIWRHHPAYRPRWAP